MWTLDEQIRRRYVRGMTGLGIWYARMLLERGEVRGEEMVTVLSKRVDLYRLTDLWQGANESADALTDARWIDMAQEIAGWLVNTPIQETDRLEARVLAFLEPSLEKRLPKDVGPPPTRPFGCWTYELGWPGLGDRPGLRGKIANTTHVTAFVRRHIGLPPVPSRDGVLHIMNIMVPRSPFDDLPHLAGTLQDLIAEVRRSQPQVRELWCNTWLNEHPKFRELMPEAWFRNGIVAQPSSYRNWWGQFARRDGDFNEAAARQFRASGGVFPYRAMQCHAGLDEIDRHLKARFG